MTNPSKIGHDYERTYAALLHSRGYLVTRSAASKGAFDLIAYNPAETIFCALTRRRLSCRMARHKVTVYREYVSHGVVRWIHMTQDDPFCEHDG